MAVMAGPLFIVPPTSGWPYEQACHLLCLPGEEVELHTIAGRLGLRPTWFQRRPIPHYNLTEGKRHQAIRQGASAIDAAAERDVVRRWREHQINQASPRPGRAGELRSPGAPEATPAAAGG